MAAFDTTRPTPFFSPRPILGLRTLVASLHAWNDARVTRKALGRLSTRELADIGLVRSDIERVVAGSYR